MRDEEMQREYRIVDVTMPHYCPVIDVLLSSPFLSSQQQPSQAPWILPGQSHYHSVFYPWSGEFFNTWPDPIKVTMAKTSSTTYYHIYHLPLFRHTLCGSRLVPSSSPSASDCHRTASARTQYTAPQMDPAIWYCRCTAH